MDEERNCAECGEPIEDGDEVEIGDGEYVCPGCFDDNYFECEMCGAIQRADDAVQWGDCRICQDCLEEQCPSFDEEENLEETKPAREALRAKYIGKEACEEYRGSTFEIEWGDDPRYTMEITVDDDCLISDIAPISAEMLLWESVNSSEYRPYPIDPDDYEIAAETIDEEVLAGNDEEEE